MQFKQEGNTLVILGLKEAQTVRLKQDEASNTWQALDDDGVWVLFADLEKISYQTVKEQTAPINITSSVVYES